MGMRWQLRIGMARGVRCAVRVWVPQPVWAVRETFLRFFIFMFLFRPAAARRPPRGRARADPTRPATPTPSAVPDRPRHESRDTTFIQRHSEPRHSRHPHPTPTGSSHHT